MTFFAITLLLVCTIGVGLIAFKLWYDFDKKIPEIIQSISYIRSLYNDFDNNKKKLTNDNIELQKEIVRLTTVISTTNKFSEKEQEKLLNDFSQKRAEIIEQQHENINRLNSIYNKQRDEYLSQIAYLNKSKEEQLKEIESYRNILKHYGLPYVASPFLLSRRINIWKKRLLEDEILVVIQDVLDYVLEHRLPKYETEILSHMGKSKQLESDFRSHKIGEDKYSHEKVALARLIMEMLDELSVKYAPTNIS